MNRVRIFAVKCCVHNPRGLVSYTNVLSREATTFPGFIKSQKYWKVGSVNTLITLSDWDNITFWNDWYRSEKREDIADFFNNDIITEKYTILVGQKPVNNNFLL